MPMLLPGKEPDTSDPETILCPTALGEDQSGTRSSESVPVGIKFGHASYRL